MQWKGILNLSYVFSGFKKGNIADDTGEVNYVSSLPFSLSLFNNVGLRQGWQFENSLFFYLFQDCNLLGDERSIKRRDEMYLGNHLISSIYLIPFFTTFLFLLLDSSASSTSFSEFYLKFFIKINKMNYEFSFSFDLLYVPQI